MYALAVTSMDTIIHYHYHDGHVLKESATMMTNMHDIVLYVISTY